MNAYPTFAMMAERNERSDTEPAFEDNEDAADDGLGSYIYLLSEKSWTETFKWRSMMLQEDGIYLSSVKESRSEVFERKVNERAFLEKRLVIPYSMLSELVTDAGVMQLHWFDRNKGKDVRSRFKFQDEEELERAVSILVLKMNWQSYPRAGNVWREFVGRGIGLLLTAMATWMLLRFANALEQGIQPELDSRHKATELFLWKLAGWLGTTGIWITGSLVTLLILVLAVRWFRGRQSATVWHRSDR